MLWAFFLRICGKTLFHPVTNLEYTGEVMIIPAGGGMLIS